MLMAGGKVQNFVDDRLDFNRTNTVVMNKDLYAFKDGCPVEAYKIANFISRNYLVKTSLPSLPFNFRLGSFSVCHWAGNIVLSGG